MFTQCTQLGLAHYQWQRGEREKSLPNKARFRRSDKLLPSPAGTHAGEIKCLFVCVCVCVCLCRRRHTAFPLLLLRHAALVVHVDRYRGLWGLEGRHLQRSLHGQEPFRREAGGHLLDVGCRGEAGGGTCWIQIIRFKKIFLKKASQQLLTEVSHPRWGKIRSGRRCGPWMAAEPCEFKENLGRGGMNAGRWRLLLLLFRAWNLAISSSQPSPGRPNPKLKGLRAEKPH